jgi:D-alanyl-D-alanine carboxypeptidase
LSSRFGFSFDPGASWDYSSTNYYLLGVIAEQITGKTLAEAYRDALYRPLRLTNTWLPKLEAHAGTLPTGYLGPVRDWKHSEMFGTLGPTTVLDQSTAELSAGGLAATADDALAFLGALMDGRIVQAPRLADMMPSQPIAALGNFDGPPSKEKTDAYGQGLARMQLAKREMIGHGGLYNGHSAGLWYLPSCHLSFVVYANRGLVNIRAALETLVDQLAALPGVTCAPQEGPQSR